MVQAGRQGRGRRLLARRVYVVVQGIVYIIGDLDLAGTSYVGGSVLAESSATVTTGVAGTCDIEHNITKVEDALDLIKYRSPQIVSWKEIPE